MQYMNPFDFVPFHGEPNLKTLEEWKNIDGGELITGKIKVRLKAITYLNISGIITASSHHINERKFYKRIYNGNSLPCVPGSSIKGMLRSFIEALTNGFVSSYNVGNEGIDKKSPSPKYHSGIYAKKKGDPRARPPIQGRHIGFLTSSYPSDLPRKEFNVGSKVKRKFFEFTGVLPDVFKIPEKISLEEKIDTSSFLFGITALPVDKKEAGAIKGRIRFSDVFFPIDTLTTSQDHPKALDIVGNASFGSPNPNISNWWYFTPKEIRLRKTIINGQLRNFAEFVGNKLRGRKFYFHQDPSRCIDWYNNNWKHISFYSYNVECIKPEAKSLPFFINFYNIPKILVKLFIASLCPGKTVRHKLGALKPFGFGSIESIVEEIEIEKKGIEKFDLMSIDGGNILTKDSELKEWANTNQERNQLNSQATVREDELMERGFIDRKSWEWLRFILHCPQNLKNDNRIFIYPSYDPSRNKSAEDKGFAQTLPIKNNELDICGKKIKIPCNTDLKQIAEKLYKNNKKLPIDFHIYQKNADNFKKICIDAGLYGFTHTI